MKTIVLPCSCTASPSGNPQAAAFQDATFGRGKRVHNRRAEGQKAPEARCTVCGTSRTV